MAVLAVQQGTLAGAAFTLANAAEAGDSFVNDGRTYFLAENGGAGEVTVTIASETQCSFGYDHNVTVTIAASAKKLVGPFDPRRFNDANGKIAVTYSGVTSVQVAAIRM